MNNSLPDPPKLILNFFQWFCHRDLVHYIEGDLVELFHERVQEKGLKNAKWYFVWEVIKLFRPSIIRPLQGTYRLNNYGMLENYIKTAIRNLWRHKAFSFINILGLSGGITCCLLIFIFVNNEYSYDDFHEKRDRIYRVHYKIQEFNIARIPPIMSEHIESYFPEVERTGRMYTRGVSVQILDDKDGAEVRFEEPNVFFTDASMLEIFTFEEIKGSLKNALDEPFKVILNEEIAEKYFGKANPIGKQVVMEGASTFEVVAVVKDFPANSHLHFDMLVPYDNMFDIEPENFQDHIKANFQMNWMVSHSFTYVLLNPGANSNSVDAKFPEFVAEKIPDQMQKDQSFLLQPLDDIHLNEVVQASAESSGSRTFLYIFMVVGALTLLIACINFVNLSTARSLERTKEIGIRKVLGAWKSNLISQFLGESFIFVFLASIFAVILTILLLPILNELTDKSLSSFDLIDPVLLGGFFLLILFTGFLAGLYPAFFVTRIPSINSLKGNISNPRSGGILFRKVLIVVQFCVSIVLLSSTFIVFDQLDLLRNKPLGFDKNLLINVPIQSQNLNNVFGGIDETKSRKLEAFHEAVAQIPSVISSAASSFAPGFGITNRNIIPEGFTEEDNMLASVYAVDFDFIDTYNIDMIAGRDFSKDYKSDVSKAFIINEFATSHYQFGTPEEALGKEINVEGKKGKVIGVVNDFHFLPLTEPMTSLVMEISPHQYNYFSIRIHNQNIHETISSVEVLFNDFFPEESFTFTFLDQTLRDSYRAQEQLGTVIGHFSILAILISCLGSYGLIMFVATQRTKEIGIRKTLGSSVSSIVVLLSRRFIVLSGIAAIISIPFTIWFTYKWLQNFSYRIEISPLTFLYSSLITIALVLIVISFQSIKAALMNPAIALRDE